MRFNFIFVRFVQLTLLLALLCVTPAGAQRLVAMGSNPAGAPDLNTYLALQRLVCPSACVSASFYDWRTESVYRSTPGLHLGYDIAMPAGTPAIAGWPGQVTRVANWFGAEYGITVLSPSGYETTYGHLSPKVKVGDVLNAGDTVGLVVNDHVDVKMRGPDGNYFDYGHAAPPAVGLYPMTPGSLHPSRTDAQHLYDQTYLQEKIDQEQLKEAQSSARIVAAELDELRTRVRKSKADLPRLKAFLADGLVARVEVEKAAADAKSGTARVIAMQARLASSQRDITMQRTALTAVQSQLAAIVKVMRSMGMSPRDAQADLRRHADPQVTAEVRALKEMQARDRASRGPHAARSALAAARADADRMQTLFEQGVVSRVERDRARAKYDAMRKN